jgi:hypothetical protein
MAEAEERAEEWLTAGVNVSELEKQVNGNGADRMKRYQVPRSPLPQAHPVRDGGQLDRCGAPAWCGRRKIEKQVVRSAAPHHAFLES